ncbi:hypothetical protein GCM10025857_47630 [Alicyclobacillus contaminans]|nr:hypothetical protein GCM10025857_47630 [Alicyclobacillus contaminans]
MNKLVTIQLFQVDYLIFYLDGLSKDSKTKAQMLVSFYFITMWMKLRKLINKTKPLLKGLDQNAKQKAFYFS